MLLQDVIFSRASIFGATTDLVPCAILMICVLQGAEAGALFSLIAALLYYFAGSAPGVYVILFLPLLGSVAAAFRQGYLRKGFAASMLCTGAAMLVYELAVFVVGLFLDLTSPSRLLSFVLTAAFSMVVAPLLYLLAKAISAIGGESWKE